MWMDMINTLLEIAGAFFTMAAIVVFFHCFYDTGFKWSTKKALLCLANVTAQVIVGRLTNYSLLSLVFVVPEFFILTYDYPGKKIRAYGRCLLLSFPFSFATIALSELATYLLSPFTDADFLSMIEMDSPEWLRIEEQVGNTALMFTNILAIIFFGVAFFYLFFKVYRKGIAIKTTWLERLFLWLYPVVCYALNVVVLFVGKESSATLMILTSMSILLTLIIPYFVYSSLVSQYYRTKTVFQENHMQAQLSHFNQYKQTQEETAQFRHDIRNHLLCLNDLLQAEKSQEATAYLRELLDVSDTLRAKYVSGDDMLDCIIGVKSGLMAEHGIDFQLDGVLAGGLPWKTIDICNVFANALDNAIEACLQLPDGERHIQMTIRSTDRFWLVAIQNPVPEQVDTDKLFQKTGGFTTKSDGRQHGIGTYNMLHTVESNGGIINAQCDERYFTLEIMIHKA